MEGDNEELLLRLGRNIRNTWRCSKKLRKGWCFRDISIGKECAQLEGKTGEVKIYGGESTWA